MVDGARGSAESIPDMAEAGSEVIALSLAQLEEVCRKAAREAFHEGLATANARPPANNSQKDILRESKIDYSREMGPDPRRDPRTLGRGP